MPDHPRDMSFGMYTDMHASGSGAYTTPGAVLPAELAERVLDSMEQAVIVTDRRGEITYWNAWAERLYGWPAEEARGRSLAELIAEADAQWQVLVRALLYARTYRGRLGVRRRDGGRFTAMVIASPVREPTGVVTGAVTVSWDLTAQELAAIALEQTAERAREERNEFLAVMSHEIRTPLTAILGYQELLDAEIGGPLTDAQRLHLNRIRTSSWHLLDLTEQMLSMSRLDSGKETLRVERFSAVYAAHEVAALLEAQVSARGLRLLVDTPAEDVVLESDAGKLRQVLLNLLTNAVKFTPAGEVTLSVNPRADGHVEFRVRDTGIGFAPDDRDRIFEPFTQLDRTETRMSGGVGLGLAVVRRLVDLLGGTITVTSTPGAGSVFCITLNTTAPAPP